MLGWKIQDGLLYHTANYFFLFYSKPYLINKLLMLLRRTISYGNLEKILWFLDEISVNAIGFYHLSSYMISETPKL